MTGQLITGLIVFGALGGALIITVARSYRKPRRNFALEQIRELVIDNNLKLSNMPTKAEFQAAFAEVNDALNNIGDDITRLTEQLSNGDLTDAEEAEVLAELTALGTRAKEIAGRTAEPGNEEPVEPTDPVEPEPEA